MKKLDNSDEVLLADTNLGLLKSLPGVWVSTGKFGRSTWAQKSLPFNSIVRQWGHSYFCLEHVYCDMLEFSVASKNVPGMEIIRTLDSKIEQDLVALEYVQSFACTPGFPDNSNAATPKHSDRYYESGLWVHMLNHHQIGPNLVKFNTSDCGVKVFAFGSVVDLDTAIDSGIDELDSPCCFNRRLKTHPDFELIGKVRQLSGRGFPEAQVCWHHALLQYLRESTPSNFKRAFRLSVSTKKDDLQGIRIPFFPELARKVCIETTIWIYELEQADGDEQSYFMQYFVDGLFSVARKSSGELVEVPFINFSTLAKSTAGA